MPVVCREHVRAALGGRAAAGRLTGGHPPRTRGPVGVEAALPRRRLRSFFERRLTLTTTWKPPWSTYLPLAEGYLRQRPELPGLLISHHLRVEEAGSAFRLAGSKHPGRRKVVLSAEL
ncbi:hypothetical protein ACWCYY_31580 [Kitasatospora sp. NPDC001664]